MHQHKKRGADLGGKTGGSHNITRYNPGFCFNCKRNQFCQDWYLYVTGHLQIRHLADLYVFYRKTAAENQLQDLEDRLKEFKVNILAQKLLHLSYMWFGTREECASMETKEEELQVFDILEKNVFYGMTGKFGPETDEQALDLRSDILKEEEWENRMEKRALFYRRLREFFSLVRRQLKELYDIWFSR